MEAEAKPVEPTEQENYDKTFIDEPAILDKHKAAAVIVDGKYNLRKLVQKVPTATCIYAVKNCVFSS